MPTSQTSRRAHFLPQCHSLQLNVRLQPPVSAQQLHSNLRISEQMCADKKHGRFVAAVPNVLPTLIDLLLHSVGGRQRWRGSIALAIGHLCSHTLAQSAVLAADECVPRMKAILLASCDDDVACGITMALAAITKGSVGRNRILSVPEIVETLDGIVAVAVRPQSNAVKQSHAVKHVQPTWQSKKSHKWRTGEAVVFFARAGACDRCTRVCSPDTRQHRCRDQRQGGYHKLKRPRRYPRPPAPLPDPLHPLDPLDPQCLFGDLGLQSAQWLILRHDSMRGLALCIGIGVGMAQLGYSSSYTSQRALTRSSTASTQYPS